MDVPPVWVDAAELNGVAVLCTAAAEERGAVPRWAFLWFIRNTGEWEKLRHPWTLERKLGRRAAKAVESNELRGYTEKRRKKKFVDRGCRKIRLRGSFGRS